MHSELLYLPDEWTHITMECPPLTPYLDVYFTWYSKVTDPEFAWSFPILLFLSYLYLYIKSSSLIDGTQVSLGFLLLLLFIFNPSITIFAF